MNRFRSIADDLLIASTLGTDDAAAHARIDHALHELRRINRGLVRVGCDVLPKQGEPK